MIFLQNTVRNRSGIDLKALMPRLWLHKCFCVYLTIRGGHSMILEKDIIKKIEYYFYNYEQEYEQLEILTEDIIYGVQMGFIEGGKSNAISSKTENSALELMDQKHEEKEKWLKVVEETKARFKDTEYEGVFNLTYKEQYKLPKILRILAMEKSCYYDKRNDIILYAAFKATEKNLIIH